MSKYRIDMERINEALDRILLASRTGQGPFGQYHLPQECRNYPKNVTSDQDIANFLFVNLIHQSGGSNTESSFRGHRRLFERYPEIYDSRSAVDFSANEIREMMKSVGLSLYKPGRYGGKRPEWLLHNADILNQHWGSDPRNLLLSLPDDEIEAWWTLIDRVVIRSSWKLMGFQEKILALFVHLFVDARLVPAFDVPPAIDIHQDRFFGSLNLVRHRRKIGPWKELNFFRDQIRRSYLLYAHSRDITMAEIGEAVWFYGREMCKYAPSAYSKDGSYIGAGVLTPESGKRPGKWKPYSETCGNCIVSDFCVWSMPHVVHYNRGQGKGGLLFVPRDRLADETPCQLDYNAPLIAKCTRHQGNFWNPNTEVGCIGCQECDKTLHLPERLR